MQKYVGEHYTGRNLPCTQYFIFLYHNHLFEKLALQIYDQILNICKGGISLKIEKDRKICFYMYRMTTKFSLPSSLTKSWQNLKGWMGKWSFFD